MHFFFSMGALWIRLVLQSSEILLSKRYQVETTVLGFAVNLF